MDPPHRIDRRSRGGALVGVTWVLILIAGIITMGTGIGLTLFLAIMLEDHGRHDRTAAVGLIPLFVGLSMIVAWLAARRMKNGNGESQKPPM